MSLQKPIYTALMAAGILASAISMGCTTAPTVENEASSRHQIRHTLREVAEYDTPKMIALLDRELNSGIKDDQIYFNRAVMVLGQTILVQPHFAEREATVREFKSKIEQSEYLDLLPQAAEQLLSISSSGDAADQASSLYALTNLIIEVRSAYNSEKDFRPDLHALLVRLRDANIKVSDDAKRYAHEQLADLVSPSDEAAAVLNILDGTKS